MRTASFANRCIRLIGVCAVTLLIAVVATPAIAHHHHKEGNDNGYGGHGPGGTHNPIVYHPPVVVSRPKPVLGEVKGKPSSVRHYSHCHRQCTAYYWVGTYDPNGASVRDHRSNGGGVWHGYKYEVCKKYQTVCR